MQGTLNQKKAIKLLRKNGWTRTAGGKHQVKMTKPGERPITLASKQGTGLSAGIGQRDTPTSGAKMNRLRGCDMELTANVHREGDSYWADVPTLPGCFASGDSLDELFDSLLEGVQLYLSEEESRLEVPDGSLQITAAVLSDTSGND